MLSSLHIENVAVIEKADIEPGQGLNVLTGETGAGKSIVIDALNAVLGERVSRDVVRTGSDEAHITAIFSDISSGIQNELEELGVSLDQEGCLIIQRTISAGGKSGCRINGRPVTAAILRTIGRMLVNIHGQHENQALLSPERHVDYLEQIGGIMSLRSEYNQAYQSLCDKRRQLEQTQMDEGMKARRIDMLRFQIDEIESAGIRVGEEAELRERRQFYRNAEKIALSLSGARKNLTGDEQSDGALNLLSDAVAQIRDAGRYVTELDELGQRAESLLYELEECAGELRDYATHLDFEPDELENVEQRLDTIRRMTSKYGPDEQAVLNFAQQARSELDSIEMSDVLAERLKKELAASEQAATEAAIKLSKARHAAAADFESKVSNELKFLDMPDVKFVVSINPVELGPTGADSVEFLISANPGEQPRPLGKIASGGEFSRIMLALKSVMAEIDDIDTLVYDEIDTGISGRAAHKVGIKLRQTAKSRQVICVTHLAQIAAMAHQHFLIDKTVRDGRTYTNVLLLDIDGRERELARIIGGGVTDANISAAREMLLTSDNM
ncbi:MAG: DNA repair protein RecN [Oscillospiraceae bacterium]|nr:DNA repair protein RecN [Oscillospiraceae bacterium]